MQKRVILLACACGQGLSFSFVIHMGIFSSIFLRDFGISRSELALIMALGQSFLFGFGPVSQIITDKIGFAPATCAAGLLLCGDLIASSFIQSFSVLILLLGPLLGALRVTKSLIGLQEKREK